MFPDWVVDCWLLTRAVWEELEVWVDWDAWLVDSVDPVDVEDWLLDPVVPAMAPEFVVDPWTLAPDAPVVW